MAPETVAPLRRIAHFPWAMPPHILGHRLVPLSDSDKDHCMPDVAPVLIDGAWVAASATATREIRNPATLDSLGLVAECGAADVAAAVEAAARAQPDWWRVPGVEKANYLRPA